MLPALPAGTGAAYAKHKHPASGYAVAGVAAGNRFARVEDPRGNLGAALLAETVVRLAARPRNATGLLPLPELIGREEAAELAARSGAHIITGSQT